ncbi:MAG: bifunctional 4-hydroxy-2-oxoglutarate aldolase/2-dehydro-3-deoxy-phosphogluconate aldolase [Lachnospiraceae bacterium]
MPEQKNILELIENRKIVPVVKLYNSEDSLPLCEALCEGGLPVAEITFRTEAAEDSIRLAAKAYPDMLIGAGTIVNTEQAKRAVDAGAKFLVTPGFSKKVTEYAAKNHILIFPGVCTPTEVMCALEYNLDVVKFFPAKQYGGPDTINALSAPFPSIRFMPTGGITAANIRDYLKNKKVIACGGSWMVKDTYIKEHQFTEIIRLTKEAVKLTK